MKVIMRLWKHPNGTYYAELERNRRRSLGTKDAALAQKIYRKLKAEFLLNKVAYLEGRYREKRTLAEFEEEYLAWVYQVRAENTYIGACSAFRSLARHLPSDTQLHRITRLQLDQIQCAMLKEVKPSTVNARFRHYRAAFSKALEWEYLRINPFRGLKALPEPDPPPRFLSPKDLARIFDNETDPRYLAFWKLALLTGLRRREILSLTWEDIQEGQIIVSQSKNRHPRIIWIFPELQQVLDDIMPTDTNKLFPWSLRQVSRKFHMLVQSLGIKARLHDLRHSYASYAVMAGIPLKTVQELMGHRSLQSTQRYAHLSQEHMAQAQLKLANALNLRQMPFKTQEK